MSASHLLCGCPQCLSAAGAEGASPALAGDYDPAWVYPSSGDDNVDALLAGDTYRWNDGGTWGQPVTVTYSFMDAVPDYYGSGDITDFQVFNDTMKAVAQECLAQYAAIANISFVEVSDSVGGQIRFGTNDQASSAGYAYYPSSSGIGGDVWLNNDESYNMAPAAGNYGYLTMIHEIGHALGMKHPGNYGSDDEGPYLSGSYDSTDYTVMSYNTTGSPYASSLGPYDIATIQFLYGPTGAATIGRMQAAGDGATALYGSSSVDDVLLGGAGNDTLSGYGGSDQMLGKGGADYIVGGGGAELVYGNRDADSIWGGDDSDTLYGGQQDDQMVGGYGADVVYGNYGTDNMWGSSGADVMYGGQDGDVLSGGADSDTLYGNLGNDYLAGNSGYDIFYMSNNSGQDTVGDFEAYTDTLYVPYDINGSGLTSSSAVVANGTATGDGFLIDLGGGHSVLLSGLSSLSSWDVTIVY